MANEDTDTRTAADAPPAEPKGSIPRNCDSTVRGNIGTLPSRQKTKAGGEMVRTRLAVNMAASSVPPEEREKFTEWYQVIAFQPAQMERLMKVQKGELVTINGGVTLHEWQSEKGPRTERTIIAEYVRSASAALPPDAAAGGGAKSTEPPGE